MKKREPISIPNFIDEELKPFSSEDSFRSIPSIVDGFKPTQRKVIFGMLKRGESADFEKVEVLAAYCSSITHYHHGVNSMETTMINMAQTCWGTNNLNLLTPKGQFGTRLSPVASSSRYVRTRIDENFKKIFRKEDNLILVSQYEDQTPIEPKHYYPILPYFLINGANGIGTGYAVTVLNRNPEEMRQYIIARLNKKPTAKAILPWYKDFSGKIFRTAEGKIQIEGVLKVINTTTIEITELPLGTYQEKYKSILNALEDDKFITDYSDDSTKTAFKYRIKCPRETTSKSHDELMRKFKLVTTVTENFTYWTEQNRIKVFKNEVEALNYFIDFRLTVYERRRVALIAKLNEDLAYNNEKMRFIQFYIANSQEFSKKSKKDCVAILEKNNFKYIEDLLQLHVYHLTGEEIEKLKAKIKEIEDQIKFYESTTAKVMYLKELEELKL